MMARKDQMVELCFRKCNWNKLSRLMKEKMMNWQQGGSKNGKVEGKCVMEKSREKTGKLANLIGFMAVAVMTAVS